VVVERARLRRLAWADAAGAAGLAADALRAPRAAPRAPAAAAPPAAPAGFDLALGADVAYVAEAVPALFAAAAALLSAGRVRRRPDCCVTQSVSEVQHGCTPRFASRAFLRNAIRNSALRGALYVLLQKAPVPGIIFMRTPTQYALWIRQCDMQGSSLGTCPACSAHAAHLGACGAQEWC